MSNKLAMVMFGATGDLAKKYLWRSIKSLVEQNKIDAPDIIGVASRNRELAEFQQLVTETSQGLDWWQSISYLNGNLDQDQVYNDIGNKLDEIEPKTIIFVLAVAPEYFIDIAKGLDASGLANRCRSQGREIRILIEKPFGTDLESARELDTILCKKYHSDEIYRLDHYLGKSMIQNLYSLRSANPILESTLNSSYIEKIIVRFLETNDSSDRGLFYDKTGAWRDVGQNHMLQILAAGLMPKLENNNDLHTARTDFFQSLDPINSHNWRKGQYQSFTKTSGVASNSVTETYFEIELESSTDKWHGVPIQLIAGKATSKRESSITYYVKNNSSHSTKIVFEASPNERAVIELLGQDDSHGDNLVVHEFTFSYAGQKTDAYERVFYHVITEDDQWFSSSDEIIAQWELADEVSAKLQNVKLETYPDGELL